MSQLSQVTIVLTLSVLFGFAYANDKECPFVDSTSIPGQVGGIAAYSYSVHHRNGPSRWGDLDCSSPKYAMFSPCPHCGPSSCDGKSQSPINILTKNLEQKPAQEAPKINFSSTAKMAYKIVSGGFKLACKGTCGATTFKDKKFVLYNVHMHFWSEHLVNNVRYPLELHFVHVSADGELLVVAKFFKLDLRARNKELKKFFTIASSKSTGTMDLHQLWKPSSSKIMVYGGSLTTPPCTEGVTFVLSPTIGAASPRQLVQLSRLCGRRPKNRPIQKLNGRTISMYD